MTVGVVALIALPFLVVTGLAGGAWVTSFSDEAPPRGTLVAHCLGSAVVVWLLAAGVLARTVGLDATSVWCAAGLLLVASSVLLAQSRTRAVLSHALPELGYLAALVALSFVVWLPVGLVVLETSWAPVGPTSWYYWGLAEQIADAGHVPATSLEWGTTVSFLDDYKLFSAGTAALLVVGGGFSAVQLVTVLAVPLVGGGTALLVRALGVGPVASLAAVPFAVGTGIGVRRLTAYRPESLGIGITLLLVAVCLNWLRHGHRGSLGLAVCLAACLAQVHGIALLVGGALLVAATLVLVVEGVPGVLKRAAIAAAALATGTLVLGVVFGGASGAVHAGGLADVAGPADPTWEFIRATRGDPTSQPPSNLDLVSGVLRGAYATNSRLIGTIVVLALVILTLAIVRARRGDAVRYLLFVALWLLGLTLVAAVFAFGWSGYVPRRLGASRLVLEATLVVGPLVAAALGVMMTSRGWSLAVGRHRERGRGHLTPDRLLTALVLVVAATIGWEGSSRVAAGAENQIPDRATVEALSDLPIPEDAMILANGYTEGYLSLLTGARVLLEGRAPYTFPELLERANHLLRDAADFYARPRRKIGFLKEHDVSYVLVAPRRSFSLGTSRIMPGGRKFEGRVPEQLELVLDLPELQVYRVGKGEPADG
ncbi:MAG TPA: DUF6541 family protein [Marmoricola sp.]|nr:DUF6541 family protein [Marmoricola sp.]